MQLGILSDYMKSFDLKEVPLDDAYRLLFQYILFPASNTRIREIIKEFSHFYYLSNEHLNIFQSEGKHRFCVYFRKLQENYLNYYNIKNNKFF